MPKDPPSDNAAPPRSRAECPRCHRPVDLCVCALVPRVENRTGIFILQHAREQRHPLGTVRLAQQALARIDVAVHHPDGAEPVDLAAWLPADTALLYPDTPDRSSQDLAALPAAKRPANLLLLDGTWPQARVLYRTYPALRALRHVRLSPPAPGAYRVRREPEPGFLATLEALVQALHILEPDTTGLDALEHAFHAMVAGQQARSRAGNRRRKTRLPQRESRAIPTVLRDHPEHVVLAHGELTRDPTGNAVLLHWAARRLTVPERFEAVLSPGHAALTDARLEHTGLTRAQLASGLCLDAFQTRWRAFLGEQDVVAVWSTALRNGFRDVVGDDAGAPTLALKTAWTNRHHERTGPLAELVTRAGLTWEPEPAFGRAGEVLGQLLALARHLRSSK